MWGPVSDTRSLSYSPGLPHVRPSHRSPHCPQVALGVLQLLLQVLQALLQCPVALLQLLVLRAGHLLGALEAPAAPLQLWDGTRTLTALQNPHEQSSRSISSGPGAELHPHEHGG